MSTPAEQLRATVEKINATRDAARRATRETYGDELAQAAIADALAAPEQTPDAERESAGG